MFKPNSCTRKRSCLRYQRIVKFGGERGGLKKVKKKKMHLQVADLKIRPLFLITVLWPAPYGLF